MNVAWIDCYGVKHFLYNMSEAHIKNCIHWLNVRNAPYKVRNGITYSYWIRLFKNELYRRQKVCINHTEQDYELF